jgi:predicted Zn-dependent protease
MGTEAFEKVAAYMAKDGKITEVAKKYTLTETIKQILIAK